MWRQSRRVKTNVTKRSASANKSSHASAKLHHSKVAERRIKIRILLSAITFTLVVIFLGALSWLSFLPVLAVQDIEVSGNVDIRTRAVQSVLLEYTEKPLFGFFSRQSALLYPGAELEKILLFEFPKIESIQIDTQFSKQKVVVAIIERESYAQWCKNIEQDIQCYALDVNGFIFEHIEPSVDSLIFEGGLSIDTVNVLRKFVEPKYFNDVSNFIIKLSDLGLDVQKFVFEDQDARVYIKPSWEIRIALDKDLSSTIVNLGAVLDEYHLRKKLSELDYIDMRFGERVYHKFKESTDSNEN